MSNTFSGDADFSSHERLDSWQCKVAGQHVLPGISPMYSETDQLLAHVGWGVHDSLLSVDVQGMELDEPSSSS